MPPTSAMRPRIGGTGIVTCVSAIALIAPMPTRPFPWCRDAAVRQSDDANDHEDNDDDNYGSVQGLWKNSGSVPPDLSSSMRRVACEEASSCKLLAPNGKDNRGCAVQLTSGTQGLLILLAGFVALVPPGELTVERYCWRWLYPVLQSMLTSLSIDRRLRCFMLRSSSSS